MPKQGAHVFERILYGWIKGKFVLTSEVYAWFRTILTRFLLLHDVLANSLK